MEIGFQHPIAFESDHWGALPDFLDELKARDLSLSSIFGLYQAVLRTHSWLYSLRSFFGGHPMGCWRLNLGKLYARQAPPH